MQGRQVFRFSQQALLQIEFLRRGFDNQVSRPEISQLNGRMDVCQRLLAIFRRDLAELDAFVQITLDRLHSACERSIIDISQEHFKAGHRGHLSNAVAHRPGAEHTDSANRSRVISQIFFARVSIQNGSRNEVERSVEISGQGLPGSTNSYAIIYTIRATENAN